MTKKEKKNKKNKDKKDRGEQDKSGTRRHGLDHKPLRVPPGRKVHLADYDTGYTGGFEDKQHAREALLEDVTDLAAAQALLWASASHSLLIILQAIDAAGKDGAIKHVMSGVNPQGVDVHSFKAPTEEERRHHFLWRPMRLVPARGRIAIFNRSYYEEVLVVRVHPQFLESQHLPDRLVGQPLEQVWEARYEEINLAEKMLVDNNVCVVKFFLHLSKEEQRQRFLERLDDPEKHWKFSTADLRERDRWDDYQTAFESMLSATSTEYAPWYVIPADHKWFSRAAIADIIVNRLRQLDLQPPQLDSDELAQLSVARRELQREGEA